MKIAALYDIHGNSFALEAALREVREARVDLVVVGGDVLPGPMPHETLECLMTLDIPIQFIHGNGERVVATHLAGGDISEVPQMYREVIDWTARQLTADDRQAIARWPSTYELDVPRLGHVLFCHATPRSDTELFTRLTADERLGGLLGDVNASVVVCGHTHMQFNRRVGERRVVNAGSVGMPFQSPPGAYWLLLGENLELRRTDYDFAAAAAAIRATTFPQLEALAVRYVLTPPTEEETLQMYAGAERA